MSDNGAALWMNSGCCMGPAASPDDDDMAWSAAPFSPDDPAMHAEMAISTTSDRAGGTSSTT